MNKFYLKKYSLFLITVFILHVALSQTPKLQDVKDALLLKEQVHLHLNKTSFVKGERIWFAAYVQNRASLQASEETKLLHVGLYNEEGQQIKSAAVHIQNGVGQGYMSVDSLITEPQYYLMAYTNYMRNFKELKPYLQKLSFPYNQYSMAEPRIEAISVQFLNREHLVAGINNTIAFKITGMAREYIKDHGIKILDDQGEILIADIALNEDNIGRFQMKPQAGASYNINYELTNGESRQYALPQLMETGIDLSINNLNTEDLFISLHSTPSLSDGKTYKDLRISYLQRDGQQIIVSPEEPSTTLKIAKNSLPYGLNQVTVSLGDSILITRSFFNGVDMEQRLRTVDVNHQLNATKDSLYLYLTTTDGLNDPLYLSLSALPSQSRAYKPFQSILQSFWLSPSVNTYLPPKTQSFNFKTRKNRLDLDLRLMEVPSNTTDNYFVKEPESITYEFEQGYPIKGAVMDADLKTETQIYGIGRRRNIPFFEEIKYDGSFTHEGLLYKGDSLRLSLVDNLGKLRKPNVSLERTRIDSTAYTDYLMDTLEHINTSEAEMTTDSTPLVQEPDVTELDEVIVKAKNWMQSSTISLNTAEVVGRRILDDDIKKNPTFGTYMRRLGYRLAISDMPGKFRILSRIPVPGKKGIRLPIAIIINGFAQENKDFVDFPLSRVAAIFYDSFGYIFVNVVLRPGFYDPYQEDNYKPVFLADGLLPPIDYRDPLYLNISSNAFSSYAALHWEANLVLNEDNQIKVVVPLHEQKQILLQIEGMDSSGRLLNYSQKIDPY